MYRGTITKTDVKSTYGPVNIYFKTDLNLSYKYLQFTRLSTVNLICLNVSAVGTTVIDMLCCLETAKIFFHFIVSIMLLSILAPMHTVEALIQFTVTLYQEQLTIKRARWEKFLSC